MRQRYSRILLTAMGAFLLSVSFQNCAPSNVEFNTPENERLVVGDPDPRQPAVVFDEYEDKAMEVTNAADHSETEYLSVYATIGSFTTPDLSNLEQSDQTYVAHFGFFDIVYK